PLFECDRQIERGKGALSDDDGMHELDRDMLRVSRVRAAAEGQQASAAQEALRHLAAGVCEIQRFAREEALDDLIAREQPLLNVRSELRGCLHCPSKSSAADPRPAYRQSGCRHIVWSRALRRRARLAP